jgi:hypothetical protein
LLLAFFKFSGFCQERNGQVKNYVGFSYVTGSNYPNAFEFGYERTINLFKIKTGIGISIIPSYQYDPLSNISVVSPYKNYYKQNLVVFEATPYLFTSRKKEDSKGFFLRGGINAIPFHLKYDRKIDFYYWPPDTTNEKMDKYSLLFGLSGNLGYQFSLFGSKERGRIEIGGRTSLRMKEPGIFMLKVSAGICF